MAYHFYLGETVLPVSPSSLELSIKNKNTTVDLINEGQINILKAAGLTEISFEFLVPQFKYPFANYDGEFKPAAYYLDLVEKLKTNKTPFQFIVSRTTPKGKLLFDTNLTVSLEDYTISESVDNGFDLSISVNLKQYKSYGTKTVTVPALPAVKLPDAPKQTTVVTKPARKVTTTKKTESKDDSSSGTIYTVKKGDCLWNICKKHYGSGSKYKEVAKANNIKNPDLIYPGQKIRLP